MAFGDQPIQKAVIDTGLLLDVLILEYFRNSRAGNQKAILDRSKLSSYLARSPFLRERLLPWFESIPVVLTTTHVIAELHGFRKLTRNDQRWFWQYGMEFLERQGLDERVSIRLLDMRQREDLRDAVYEVGPTDVGLIELVREERCTLLTNDERTLASIAWGLGLDCRLVQQELETVGP